MLKTSFRLMNDETFPGFLQTWSFGESKDLNKNQWSLRFIQFLEESLEISQGECNKKMAWIEA